MPEITQEEKCFPIRQKGFEHWSELQQKKLKYPELFPAASKGSCFGKSLCWGIYFLEHLAKDQSSLPIYLNKSSMDRFFTNGDIAQRDYANMMKAFGDKAEELVAKHLNTQEKIIKRSPSYILHYQCIDGKTAAAVANSMLKNEAEGRYQSLIFAMRLEKKLNDRVGFVRHAATLSNYRDGCLLFETNSGIYKLDRNKGFNINNVVNRIENNISCLRDSNRPDNRFLVGGDKMHILITLHAKQFNTHLREDQKTEGFENSQFKIPRFKIGS